MTQRREQKKFSIESRINTIWENYLLRRTSSLDLRFSNLEPKYEKEIQNCFLSAVWETGEEAYLEFKNGEFDHGLSSSGTRYHSKYASSPVYLTTDNHHIIFISCTLVLNVKSLYANWRHFSVQIFPEIKLNVVLTNSFKKGCKFHY